MLIAVVAATLAACGGGGDDADIAGSDDPEASDDTDTAADESDGDLSEVSEPADTGDGGDTEDGDAEDARDSATFEGDLTSDDCDLLWDLFHAVGGVDLPPGQMREFLDGLPGRVPTELEADFGAMADAWRPVLDLFGELGVESEADAAGLSAADQERVQAAAAALSTPDMNEATARINSWVSSGC